ncbi:MAG TPA: hypothetical protein VFW28_10865 [Micropepsaceae bacterium]|nr:hypothetical protein [Micropepsaceae bacterium]
MRIGLPLIAAAALFAVPVAAADWQQLVFPDQQFVIETPVSLVKGSGNYRSAVVGQMPTVTYTGELDKIRYRVTVIDISKQPADPENLFAEMESIIETQGKVLENDSQRIGNGRIAHFGRELLVQANDGSLRRIGLMYANGRLYQIEGTVLPGGDTQSIFPERFAGSILFDLDLKALEARSSNPDNFRADPAIKN